MNWFKKFAADCRTDRRSGGGGLILFWMLEAGVVSNLLFDQRKGVDGLPHLAMFRTTPEPEGSPRAFFKK